MLGAVLALAALHLVLWVALYATRIPAMIQMKISARRLAKPGVRETLPSWARNVADNYNHLAEAPTVFYAVVIVLVLLKQEDALNTALAWSYVGLRVVHSLIQTTFNNILLRFSVFSVSWLVLGGLIVRGLVGLYG
ncbi:hypothetical protein ABAC460_15425 [Asticcacaulis sp. AC460]|uniref:MAPEG family protein n=1 Tax=Asticcacaulis sp. AC460 TaxID=1282360 RepID=UPI0003C3CED1|nr:MAPEG family protein [Asticcacaulis sp. AC460]ESQ88421.1 hypothetical protein ABAC460_15425 [Asticcacaulis sp. AC460]